MDICAIPGTCAGGFTQPNCGMACYIFYGLLSSTMSSTCQIGDASQYPDDIGLNGFAPEYDFIVVGAGSAGSAIANRLSEISDWNILLIEAGGNPSATSDIPGLAIATQKTSEDWQFQTTPQKYACHGMKDNRCNWPRGKTLGGSSALNFLLYVRGNKRDYDQWAESGLEGWSYDDVLPYFKKSENYREENNYHSTGGFLDVGPYFEQPNPLSNFMLGAANELGYPTRDCNAESQTGFMVADITHSKNIRENTAKAFLTPIKERTNLHVAKFSTVTKLNYKKMGNRITGVDILKEGHIVTVNARKEVILSAGAIGSPHLMMVSGFGPKDILENAGVNVLRNMPNVGGNMQDHLMFPHVIYALENVNAVDPGIDAMYEYLMHRTGGFASMGPQEVIGFYRSPNADPDFPDLEFGNFVMPANSSIIKIFVNVLNYNEKISQMLLDLNSRNTLLFVQSIILRPKSSGNIAIQSSNINDKPLLNANYFSDEGRYDIDTMLEGIKFSLEFGKTMNMQALGAKLVGWFSDCGEPNDEDTNMEWGGGGRTREYWECALRQVANTLYHQSCTMAMGTVVDEKLRVHGIRGLRVADASVMPNVTSGNTNAPTIMIAEKASDMIKAYWGFK